MVKSEGVDFSTMVDKMRKEFYCDDNNNQVVHQPEVLRLQTKDALRSLLHKVSLRLQNLHLNLLDPKNIE